MVNLNKNTDMAAVVHAMAQPDSGLEVRDRMWLKITIPQAFIGLYCQHCGIGCYSSDSFLPPRRSALGRLLLWRRGCLSR